ncbi:MAG: dTMP kinase [Planctomycetota bacterium]
MFLSLDGVDGVGKSTQISLLCGWLTELGKPPITCRDPGGTPLGERLRELVLHAGDETPLGMPAEMLLYMASRAQLVEQVIQPALAEGKVVVSDRYLLANLVYQGHAGGLPVDALRQVGAVATGGLKPDATFVLDMDPAVADARIQRSRDRMESRGSDYRHRLREGFLAEAASDPNIHVIDANQSPEAVHADVRAIVEPLF